MPAETTRFRWSFLPDSLVLLLPPPPLLLVLDSLEAAKKRVTGRRLIVSNDNLMLLSAFALSAAALSLLPSPLPCSRVQLPTTGSASRKGTRAGGTLTDVHRVAATPRLQMGTSECPVQNFGLGNHRESWAE